MIKIIDNLLPYEQWQALQNYYLSSECTWAYSDVMVSLNEINSHFQFVHGIKGDYLYDTERLNRIHPVITKLNVDFLLRVKVNLTTRTHEPFQSDFHRDTDQNNLTAIYYLNTCNGKTRFQNPDIEDVDSVGNRVVIFNSKQKHCTVTATDVKARVVANINYLPKHYGKYKGNT